MSHNLGGKVTGIGDGVHLDPFARLRVSTPTLLFSGASVHDTRPDLVDTQTNGAGASVTAMLDGSVRMRVGTVAGEYVRRRGHTLWTYRAGQGHRCNLTFAFNAAKANLRQEVGFYDGPRTVIGGANWWGNGVVLRRDGLDEARLQLYSNGALVDDVPRSLWADPMDGSGPSGINASLELTQILGIDFQALYAGRVRVVLNIGGVPRCINEFKHANVLAVPFIASANLAAWYNVENLGVTASQSNMLAICQEVSREGGVDDPGVVDTISTDLAGPTVGTAWSTVMAFRLWQGFPSALLRPVAVDFLNRSGNVVEWGLFLNPTTTIPLVWGGAVRAGTRMVETSVTATTIVLTGGLPTATRRLGGGLVAATSGAASRGAAASAIVADRTSLGFGLGGVADVCLLAAKASGAGSSVDVDIDIAQLE